MDRHATQQPSGPGLRGITEVDETYVKGEGIPKGEKPKRGRGSHRVTAVVGMKERGGGVRAKAISSLRKDDTLAWVLQNVDRPEVDAIYTHANNIYDDLSDTVPHDSIDHSVSLAVGDLHTNGIEGFWSLLKRGVIGSYHHVSREHLQRYVDEHCWRSNRTKDEEVFYSLLGAQVAPGPLICRELVTKRR